jgi:hypothetical protein
MNRQRNILRTFYSSMDHLDHLDQSRSVFVFAWTTWTTDKVVQANAWTNSLLMSRGEFEVGKAR